MSHLLDDEGLDGVVWSTIDENGTTSSGAAGLKHRNPDAPMTPATRVHVGSIAKAVLATGVLRLVSEGRLSLDTEVSAVLPGMAFDNPWRSTDPVRIRHLLEHTTGLENLRLWQFLSLQAKPDAPLMDVFSRDPSVLQVQTRPGSRFRYSNLGYTLLGMVIEAVSGERYEHYLDSQLLLPLAMNDSTFSYTTQTGPNADHGLATGHFEDGVAQAAVAMHLRPAGQFTTSAADMATFARFLMGNGTLHGKPFIAPSLMQALATPSHTEASDAGLQIGHGLVLVGRDRHGITGQSHPGNTVGFMAMLCLFPQQGRAFFVAMNTDSETADYDRFNALLIRSLRLAPSTPAIAAAVSRDVSDWDGFYIPTPWSIRPFAWVDTVFGFSRAHWDGSSFRLKPFQSKELVLEPAGARLFRAPGRHDASHVLLTSADGERVISSGIQNHVRIHTGTLMLLWSSLLTGLSGLALLIGRGTCLALRGRLQRSDALLPPLLVFVALLLPAPFFLSQSFLALGDRTTASVLLAIASGALPLSVVAGLLRHLRGRQTRQPDRLETAALLAALQWMAVLAAWGLLPLRLWH